MTDDICQENAIEISNEGTGQYFLMKLIVRIIEKSKENVSSIKTMTVKERHSQLIPIVIYSNMEEQVKISWTN